ncbi:MAG: hypothetical protein ACR2FL_11465 [Nocardioidaceae bacterium]
MGDLTRVVLRRLVRVLALTLPVTLTVVWSCVAYADAPTNWEAGTLMSGLEVLLMFVGIPVGICLLLTVFAAVTVGKDHARYLPDGSWGYPSEWHRGRELEAGHHETPEDPLVLDRGPR